MSASVVFMGLAVSIGWFFDIATLRRLHPGLASMKLNTSGALVMLGASLWLAVEPVSSRSIRVARALAIAAVAIAGATLLEYALGVDLGIDELVRPDPDSVVAPGRMSPITGSCLLAVGVAIAWLEARWTEWLAAATGLAALLAILGYLYGVRNLYTIGAYSSIALHTALALATLALGAMLARPDRTLMRIVASDLAGGVLARRLVPAAIIVPIMVALARQLGEQAGLYGTGFGRSILVASNIVVFLALILRTASEISRLDHRKRSAEAAVRESEADLAITLQSIGDAVVTTDNAGLVARINPAAERMMGWSIKEARGRPLAEVFRIVDEETGERVENPVERVLREGTVVGLANHTILIARDGTPRAIADTAAPIRSAESAVRGIVLVFQDQSEARAIQRRLRESEARKAATLESALDAMISVDSSGTIIEFNPAARAMFACAHQDVLGKPLAGVLFSPGLAGAAPELVQALTGKVPSVIGQRVELEAYRSDGSSFPAEVSITQVALEGQPAFTAFIRDVSDVRQARLALLRSNDRLRTLADVSQSFTAVATNIATLLERVASVMAGVIGDGCLVTLVSDDGQRLVAASQAHRDPALASDYKSFTAKQSVSVVTSNSVSATVIRTGQAMRANVTPEAMVMRSEEALRPIVRRLNVHGYAVVPIRVRQAVIGTLSLLRTRPGCGYTDEDVTLMQDLADRAGLAIENARLYTELEQRVKDRTVELEAVNRELELFTASVAHDLRAPLRALSGYSDILCEDHAGQLDATGLAYLARISAATRRMAHMIDDLLKLSRIDRAPLHRELVDLSQLVHTIVDRLRSAEPHRAVELNVEGGVSAQADPRLLDVALTNLLGNAWKFTSTREHTVIEFFTQPGHPTTYSVRDNGVGFDAAYARKLFGVFQRLHSAKEFEGTGLGLATVQRVIRRHGGHAWAEAELDRGATFCFTLEPAPS